VKLFWNDPGAIKKNLGEKKRGQLGVEVDRDRLARKIWNAASAEHSDPKELYKNWHAKMSRKGAMDKLRPKAREKIAAILKKGSTFDAKDADHVEKVNQLRCATHGIKIWQLLPIEG
jgi:hypothetical protein